ncbi:MAG: hypothetical protein A2846_01970 [Candidatus Doudnabacteria bacterium RIFCSPHIGHO2_01_FULL_49_9]|uniref:Membrane insertase YidC/Oxa/ALB C-terminal domain-containing protein n=1 Tax=Candidatus Doudnabacteria bacterium RIFCSPHIGHO2_01_FULL_49_9 TaxID=1817827 RepID=A0A1F5P3E7_9BACT|nr:MAG: hypothetical protein A2846_01970 [Candidatus Doudnabacteria bacterium RIFCSPHIGHO2_01_FULL_49_9]
MEIFHILLTQPLLNLLIFIYNILPGQDMGLAIIAVTILVRIILYPSFQKSLKAQKELAALQPKLEEIKEKYKNDKEAQTKATLEFYKANKINPLSSCLPLLVQLPLLIALYSVFRSGLEGQISGELYSFVQTPAVINTRFLGFLELATPSFVLALIAGMSQFVQSKMMAPPRNKDSKDKTANMMTLQLTYVMPIITVIIAQGLPAGLSLYWIVTTLFAIGQQWYIMRRHG